ncbi:MAG: hypothetical protein OEV74_02600 [Cyclobacteriaceae bacterium]|nr:hypothetical protein [Cyclobacteriaceae bacterium]
MTKLWKKWTINCAIGELLGIACAGAIAFGVNSIIGEPQSLGSKLIVLSTMMFAGFIEGMILSSFQWKVIVTKFQNIPKKEWMFYTILVGVLGWFLGMLPSLFFMPAETETQEVNKLIDFSNPYVFSFLSIGSGLVLGAIFGLFQWFSLKKYAQKAYKWIIANALGWGLGLCWIYLFASIPTEKNTITFNVLMGVIGGLFAGLSVGAITGIYLEKLEQKENHS